MNLQAFITLLSVGFRKYALHTILLVLLISCAKKRDIQTEESGTPNTMPREQILYREAREIISQWIKGFGNPSDRQKMYQLLTSSSRNRLAQLGVSNEQSFSDWFQKNVDNKLPPFTYSFSQVDILDIDITDTNKAVITANVFVQSEAREVETVACFILVRQGNTWKVPFGERGDWERSWWQQEKNFGTRMRSGGMQSYSSQSLEIDLEYPQTWDLNESATFLFPSENGVRKGIEISYLNPSSMTKEAFVRILSTQGSGTQTQEMMQAVQLDSLQKNKPVPLETREATMTEAVHTSGKVFSFYDSKNNRILLVYGAVADATVSYSTFATTIKQIVDSITFQSEL